MTNIFKNLPEVLEDKVLEYTGKIKIRNGKCMGQIQKDDLRYDILRTIPPKKGGYFMIYSQTGYRSQVIKDGKPIILYQENNSFFPQGEISLTHLHNNNSYNHIIGNKFPPCFEPAGDYKKTKKWIEYFPDL
jgi:hypothetical protein